MVVDIDARSLLACRLAGLGSESLVHCSMAGVYTILELEIPTTVGLSYPCALNHSQKSDANNC
jgi:hypothetical protein